MDQYLDLISDIPLRAKLKTLHEDLKGLITTVPASTKHHHCWTGGYYQHVKEVIYFSRQMYDLAHLNATLEGITEDDVILLAYIHDLDKVYRYKKLAEPKDGKEWDYVTPYPSYDESAKVVQICSLYGILLKDSHLDALAMHHGGWSKAGGTMTKLSTILHSADLFSTFITNKKPEAPNGTK